MAEIKLKAIPSPSNLPPEIQAFAGPVKEAIDVLLGRIGSGADAAITRRNAGQIGGGSTIINSGTPSSGGYTPDLTPPPSPSGLVATPGFSVINLEWDDAPYTVGHGHAYTVVYRSSDALRGNAVQIGMTPGTIYVDSVGSSAGPFYYWVRFVTYDGVMGPWNAADGVSASTSADPEYLLDLLAGSIDESSLKTETIGGKDAFVFSTKTFAIKYGGSGYIPFIVQTTPTVINGMTIPAGVYLDTAFMRRFVAQAGQIGALAVDDAAIANVSAAKLTIGDGTVGGSLKSTYFASGVAGWKINPDGTAEFNNVLVHGTVYAESGYFKGTLIGGAATSMSSGTGLWAGYDAGQYKARLGIPGSSRLEWNDYTFTIYGADGTVLLSTGSGIPWSKIDSRPTSLGGLDAAASTKLNGIQAGATVGADSSNLNVGLGVNLLPNTEFGGGSMMPVVLGWNPSGCELGLQGDDTWRPASAQALRLYQVGRNGNPYNIGADAYLAGGYADRLKAIPVVPGKRYEFSGKLASHRADSMLAIDFFDINGSFLGGGSSGWVERRSGGRDLANWKHAAVFAVAPAGAVYASPYWRKSDTDVGQGDSYAWLSQPYFGEAMPAQTVPSTYNPGVGRGAMSQVDKLTPDNISTYMANAAIGQAQIDRLSANKLVVVEADIDTASVSTLKIKGNAVTIPQYAETGSRQVAYQPPGNYDLLVSTPPTLYEQPAKVMAIFTLVGWPAIGNPSDNAAPMGRIVWEGVVPGGGVVYSHTRDLLIGDFYKAEAVSCSSTTALLEVPFSGCTWSVRFYIRIMYSGQTLNVVRTSAQLHGVMR